MAVKDVFRIKGEGLTKSIHNPTNTGTKVGNVKAWIRQIEIILTSNVLKKKVVFGANHNNGQDDLNISVTGKKYLSALKDAFTIRIDNLTYKEIIELISGQYYDVEIKAGYKNAVHSIFKGSVLYISNNLGDGKTNTVIILCASRLVAAYGQSRLNLSLNSGINLYSAINFIAKYAGINNTYIDEDFKYRFQKNRTEATSTIGSWLDLLSKSNGLVVRSDFTSGADISIWSPYKKDTRLIKLNNSNVILTGGFPTLTSEGIVVHVMPTFNFMPGDTISIDNSLLNIAAETSDEVYENKGFYFDESGNYMIFELEYDLSNRGGNFEVTIEAKARNLITKLTGVKNNV